MTVFVFGNPDLPEDSLPIRLLPKLREQFPTIDFQIKDPNEDWDIPEEMVILDTAMGINRVTVFLDLGHFVNAPRLTMHDFDLGSHLKFLKKLGKLKNIEIIGVPPMISENEALEELKSLLKVEGER